MKRLLLLATLAAGCGGPLWEVAQPDPTYCRAESGEITFRVPSDPVQGTLLGEWCRAVGPAVHVPLRTRPVVASGAPTGTSAPSPAGENADVISAADSLMREATSSDAAPTVVDSLVVVAWNAAVGSGALDRFVDDLRAGRLTGGDSVHHFVLLLQEVHRGGEAVPELGSGMAYPGLIDSGEYGGSHEDIVEWIDTRPALALFYAPSMRNGTVTPDGRSEDRGSAIVSTLPLEEMVAYELPVQRQRRVVPTARVRATTSAGDAWSLQLASVHLENIPEGQKNPERARLEQIEWLMSALPDAENAILGGDINTWMRGPDEIAVWRALERYPQTPAHPGGPTYEKAVLRMHLDYIFFRLSAGRATDYTRVLTPYGSDHYPLWAWVHLR